MTADLKQIPNEHLRFYADPQNKSRTEDGIIAFTWRHFIVDPTKPEWLLRLPMTKAVVRAMDTITDFVNKTTGKEITNYCVGGESKVSWTNKLFKNNMKCTFLELVTRTIINARYAFILITLSKF